MLYKFLLCRKVTQLYTYALFFHILFHCGLSEDIEYSSLCYTVRPYCLSILHNNLHKLTPTLCSILPLTLSPFYNKSDQVILLSQYSTMASHFSQSKSKVFTVVYKTLCYAMLS